MKINTSFHPLFCFLVFLISFSVTSQNACSTYYPFKEGTKFQITNFDKKGKKESVADHQILSITNNVATISTKVSDEKNKEIATSTFEVTCSGEGISIDFKSLMNPELLKQYKDMEIDMTGTNIIFPNKLNVGERLPDASLNMSINMGGLKMNMNIDMINRSVNAQGSITTSAGTFNCFALSYDTEMKMGIKQTFTIKEWIAEGVGTVKTETYNKGGKLMAYSELTSITK
ncbi:hypothetical protein EV196_10115 [Mariniflexile fucanivorans]|uniref:DUF3108 domain-containing protein n=1 Tax=Mariniflexile fucanivorans TaxID=264023 RepID=A0A4R1RQC4_9FLAO|nr:hypothetical protein [Mariniflexile fucanivorans]TCL68601.1 hypothetical protein EV196_10115 [Mariniflexile fucanivorans]